jgi:hypothetical protein
VREGEIENEDARARENEDARERERAVSIIRQNNDRFPFIIWCYKKSNYLHYF